RELEEPQQLFVGAGIFRKGVEDRLGLGPVHRLDIGEGEIFLRGKMVVERGLGDAGLLDDLVDAGGAIAVAVEEITGGLEDPLVRPAFRPGLLHARILYQTDLSVKSQIREGRLSERKRNLPGPPAATIRSARAACPARGTRPRTRACNIGTFGK